MKRTICDSRSTGYSLIEIIFSLMITSIAVLSFGTFAYLMSKIDSDINKSMRITDVKSNIFIMLSDKKVWNQIVSSANMDYPNDSSIKVNPELVCLRDHTACSQGEYVLTVLDQTGKIYFDSLNKMMGFNKKGELCETFDSINEDPNCPYQLKIKWQPICPSSGDCLDPQIKISVQTLGASNSQSLSISNQITSMTIEKPVALPPYIKSGLAYTNSTTAAGSHEVIYNVTPNVSTSASNPWIMELDASMVTSQNGGTVTLVDSTLLKYTPANNFYGLDKVKFKITLTNSGLSTIGLLYVNVMTPYTWTGLAGGGDLNTSNVKNFCGKVFNGVCDQVSFPTGPTGSLGKFVFNNTCTNCNGIINSNSYQLEFASTFKGNMISKNSLSISTQGITLNGGSFTQGQGDIRITGTGWIQGGGKFNGGSHNIYFDNDTILTINGGDFKAPSQINFGSRKDTTKIFLTVTTSAQFFHNNGTVLFYGDSSGSCSHKAWTIKGDNLNLYNLSFSAADTCSTYAGDAELLIAAGSIVTVENVLNLARGTLSGSINLTGNLVVGNNGPADGKGLINIVGNKAQTYAYGVGGSAPHIILNTTGSFSPAPGTVNFRSTSLNIIQGTFNAPTGTYILGTTGSTTMTALGISDQNQYIHNNGTLEFYGGGSGSCTHKAWTIKGPKVILHNLTHNAVDTCATYAADAELITNQGTKVIVENIFNLANGTLTGTIDLMGNMIIGNNGPADITGTVNIIGNSTQKYTYGSLGSGPNIIMNTTGSFSPAPGTTNLKVTSLIINSGTFTAPTGKLIFGTTGKSEMIALGISNPNQFLHNNGTVEFFGNPSGACDHKKWTINASKLNLYKLTLNLADSCFTISSDAEIVTDVGSKILVENNFTHLRGTLSGTIDLKGDLIIDGSARNSSGIINIVGNTAQTYSYSKGSTANVVMNTSGSFSPAIGTTNLNMRSLNIISGTFNAPSGTLTLGTNVDLAMTVLSLTNASQYIHNNGTIDFFGNGSGSCGHKKWTINTASSRINFYKGIINISESCGVSEIIASGSNFVNFEGDLSLIKGSLNGPFSLEANLTINSGFGAGSGALSFIGNSSQIVTNNGGNIPRGSITIEKNSGTLKLANNITLSGPAQCLHLKAGILDLDGHSLNISDGIGLDNILTLEPGTTIVQSGGNLTQEKLNNLGGNINP